MLETLSRTHAHHSSLAMMALVWLAVVVIALLATSGAVRTARRRFRSGRESAARQRGHRAADELTPKERFSAYVHRRAARQNR